MSQATGNRAMLESLFRPRSVAIIGASQNLQSISGRPIRYLREHGFQGSIYPINPKYDSIAGEPCYPSIKEVPEEVDVAMVAVNYKMVPQVLEECAAKGVKHAILFTAGFAEAGEEGEKMQEQVMELARRSNMRILGPNCQGVVDLYSGNASSFSASLEIKPLLKGSVGYVTQSGALGYSIFNLAQEMGVGFSGIASTGNEADLNSLDFIEYYLEDEHTKVILAYLEEVENGKRFQELAHRALQKGKPIICLKVGSSDVGQKAAASHTASMVSSDTSYEAVFKQKGVIRVGGVKEMIHMALLVERINNMPDGTNLAIVTTSGGAGILLADEASRLKLEVPELDQATQENIGQYIPDFGSTLNPVDVTAQVINEAEGFQKVLTSLTEYPHIDAIIIVISMIYGESGKMMAEDVVKAFHQVDKPIVVTWPAGDQLMWDNLKILEEGNVPWYKFPEEGINALGKLMQYRSFCLKYQSETGVQSVKPPDREKLAPLLAKDEDNTISEYYSKKLLSLSDIPVNRCELASSSQEAVKQAQDIGLPVVLKVDSPKISHKSDVGGVKLNLSSAAEVEKGYEEIMRNLQKQSLDSLINGIMVQEMVKGGTETIVGVKNEPKFGPLVMFGLGGIYVEVLKDVAFRFAPLSPREAQEMVEEIRAYKVLQGVRGEEPRDIKALIDALVKISHFAYEFENEVGQLDINPLVVLPEGQGVKALDALVIKH